MRRAKRLNLKQLNLIERALKRPLSQEANNYLLADHHLISHLEAGQKMQIIAGSKRGAKLAMLADQSVRPTAQRTRESLFNILAAGRRAHHLE